MCSADERRQSAAVAGDHHHHRDEQPKIMAATNEQKDVVNGCKELSKKKTTTTSTICSEKFVVFKDMAALCLAFFLHFTSYNGINTMQSSINGQLGIEALTVASFGGVVSNLLLAAIVIDKLGVKWAMVLAVFFRSAFPVSNFYSTWWTLIPGGAISGLSAGVVWTANSAYITWLGQRYAKVSGETESAVISRLYGIFFMFNRGSHLMGYLLTSVLLERPKAAASVTLRKTADELVKRVCASRYCYENLDDIFRIGTTNLTSNLATVATGNYSDNGTDMFEHGHGAGAAEPNATLNSSTFYRPPGHQLNLLIGCFVTMALLAVPLLTFITSPANDNDNDNEKSDASDKSTTKTLQKVGEKLSATFKHMGTTKSILLAPLSISVGVGYSFVLTTFSLAFITCSFGVDRLGYILLAAGASGAIFSVIGGSLVAIIGRKSVLSLANAVLLASLAGMLNWIPGSDRRAVFYIYVLAASWGGSTAVLQSQIAAFTSFVYRNDKSQSSANACFHLYTMTGQTLWQSISIYTCVGLQLYVIAAIMVVGLLGVIVVDGISSRQEKLLDENKMTKL